MNAEKISVNVNIVDLGKMEMLIEKGLYTNKTDFLVKAIHNELNKNASIIERTLSETEADTHIQIGIAVYTAAQLEKMKAAGKSERLYVIGRLVIQNDVPLELAKGVLSEIRVFGSCRMPKELEEYYKPGK